MSNFDTDEIRAANPIADIVGSAVPLKRAGNEYKGCCPFHADKSPSFHVVPDKGFAHCFGCGWHGDVIRFVMDFKSIDFIEAARLLGGEGGELDQSPEAKAQRDAAKTRRMEIEARARLAATEDARRIWDAAEPADPHHPYLVRKNAPVHCLRQDRNGSLVIPILDADGEIQSIQRINDSGSKLFHPGAPVALGRMNIGINMGRTILCEGYATGASIYDAIPDQVCVTFSMDNMEKVARELASTGKAAVLAADTGTSAARMKKIGEELGFPVVIPRPDMVDSDGVVGTDFNDQAVVDGKEAVATWFQKSLKAFADHRLLDGSAEVDGQSMPVAIGMVDLTSPPGFVGDLARWIESQSRRARLHLSVATALTAMGNIAGLRFVDKRDRVTGNFLAFCVAGSGTGKDAMNNAIAEIHRVAGQAGAMHGAIKSEQEIVRNLLRHQASFYVVDEVASILRKVKNSKARGGATYLEGVLEVIMSIFTKSNAYYMISGDLKEKAKEDLAREVSRLVKDVEENGEGAWSAAELASKRRQLETIDNGIERPFLSLIGFTTPVSFDDLVDYETATNGFFGRSVIFNERNSAPPTKPDFVAPPMPDGLAMRIRAIANGGEYDAANRRVEFYGERTEILTDCDADAMLRRIDAWFDQQADFQRGGSGMEALYMRAYQMVSKVSFILAIDSGTRTAEHVRWAFALVKRDLEEKSRMVTSNDRAKDDPAMSMQARIANICSDGGETLAVILNKMRPHKKEAVEKAVHGMVDCGKLARAETDRKYKGKPVSRFVLAETDLSEN